MIIHCNGALSPVAADDSMTLKVGQRDGQLYAEPIALPSAATAKNNAILSVKDGVWTVDATSLEEIASATSNITEIAAELRLLNTTVSGLETDVTTRKEAIRIAINNLCVNDPADPEEAPALPVNAPFAEYAETITDFNTVSIAGLNKILSGVEESYEGQTITNMINSIQGAKMGIIAALNQRYRQEVATESTPLATIAALIAMIP